MRLLRSWLAGTAANQRALLPARVIICFCPGRPSRYLSSHRSPQLQRCVTPNPLPERRNKSKGRGPRSLKKRAWVPPALPTLREPPISTTYSENVFCRSLADRRFVIGDSSRRREMKIYICYKYSINIDQR